MGHTCCGVDCGDGSSVVDRYRKFKCIHQELQTFKVIDFYRNLDYIFRGIQLSCEDMGQTELVTVWFSDNS